MSLKSDASLYVKCVEIVERKGLIQTNIVNETNQTFKLVKIISESSEFDTKLPHVGPTNAIIRKRINSGLGNETALFVSKLNILCAIDKPMRDYEEVIKVNAKDIADKLHGLPKVETL